MNIYLAERDRQETRVFTVVTNPAGRGKKSIARRGARRLRGLKRKSNTEASLPPPVKVQRSYQEEMADVRMLIYKQQTVGKNSQVDDKGSSLEMTDPLCKCKMVRRTPVISISLSSSDDDCKEEVKAVVSKHVEEIICISSEDENQPEINYVVENKNTEHKELITMKEKSFSSIPVVDPVP